MSKFFITGLPRCRSAWFANLLTFGNSFCRHDGWYAANAPEAFKERMDISDGNSDQCNALFWRLIEEWYPTAKWVVVERSYSDAEIASKKAFGDKFKMPAALPTRLAQLIRELKPLVVRFEDLSVETAYRVGDHCGVDIGPVRRVKQLLGMQVQIRPELLRGTVDPMPAWMGDYL